MLALLLRILAIVTCAGMHPCMFCLVEYHVNVYTDHSRLRRGYAINFKFNTLPTERKTPFLLWISQITYIYDSVQPPTICLLHKLAAVQLNWAMTPWALLSLPLFDQLCTPPSTNQQQSTWQHVTAEIGFLGGLPGMSTSPRNNSHRPKLCHLSSSLTISTPLKLPIFNCFGAWKPHVQKFGNFLPVYACAHWFTSFFQEWSKLVLDKWPKGCVALMTEKTRFGTTRWNPWGSFPQFLLHDAMLAWHMLSSCVCNSVCPSQVDVLLKRLDVGQANNITR